MKTVLLSVTDFPARHELTNFLLARRYTVRDVRLATVGAKEAAEARLLIVECSVSEPADKTSPLARFRLLNASATVIVCAVDSSEDCAIAAFRLGVNDYFRWPSQKRDLFAALDRFNSHPATTSGPELCGNFIGQSSRMRAVTETVRRAAGTESNVLITGETGTGKEVVAQSLHHLSPRAAKPMVPVNCAAIPEALLESELFGHERGAFTGAASANKGKLMLADGGTIFFDEIGDMSLHGQAKLLRAVETGEVIPLGGRAGIKTDARVISATNHSLESMVKEGGFRADLLFRLNVIRIELPPLRERAADVPALLSHFVEHFNRRWGPRLEGFDGECRSLLERYDWPGNVRELKNVVEAVYVNSNGGLVTTSDLPPAIRALTSHPGPIDERRELTEALFAMNWNVSKVAEELHISRMTVYRKLERYQINRSGGVTDLPKK